MDTVLSARAELMEEFKKGEHASWDPNHEIWMWKKREAMLTGGGNEFGEEDEEESTPVATSPK